MENKSPNTYLIGSSIGIYTISIIFRYFQDGIFSLEEILKFAVIVTVWKILELLTDTFVKGQNSIRNLKNLLRFVASAVLIYFGVMLNVDMINEFIPYYKAFMDS